MERKVIFFDADGTIIDGDCLSPKVRKTFEKLKESKHILVLSTGRALPALGLTLKELDFKNIISSAGNVTMADNEIIFNNSLTTAELKEIDEFLTNHDISYHMESVDYIYVKKGEKEEYLNRHRNMIPEKSEASEEEYDILLDNFEDVKNRTREVQHLSDITVNKIHYFDESLPFSELEKVFGDRFTCKPLSLSKEFSGGEISARGVTKEDGMRQILSHYNMPIENTIAIGDDYNDIEMLDYASYSIVLDHAPEEVKKHADFVTKNIENDGFSHAINHLELL